MTDDDTDFRALKEKLLGTEEERAARHAGEIISRRDKVWHDEYDNDDDVVYCHFMENCGINLGKALTYAEEAVLFLLPDEVVNGEALMAGYAQELESLVKQAMGM